MDDHARASDGRPPLIGYGDPTPDLVHEGRFDESFIRACLNHEIESLQSHPVFGRDGRPIVTLVMGYGDPSEHRGFAALCMKFAADAVAALLQNNSKKRRSEELKTSTSDCFHPLLDDGS